MAGADRPWGEPMRRVPARVVGWTFAVALVTTAIGSARAAGGAASITTQELREWLSYVASDELQGRAVFSEGFGLAGGYIVDHLRAWGVKPAGDQGMYRQAVRVLGVKTTSHATITVSVGGESKTFADGEGITFPKNMGGKRTLTVGRVEFVGYGLDAPGASHMDYRGKDVKDAAVIWLGLTGPKDLEQSIYRRILSGRNRYATEQLGAAASIGAAAAAGAGRAGGAGETGRAATAGTTPPTGVGRGAALPAPDFTTVQRLDAPVPPNVTASDPFFEFLFSRAPTRYDEAKIEFDKLARVTQLIYETGARVGNLDHPPVRDHQGPRAGRLTQ